MRSFLACLLVCLASMLLPVANANAADFEVRTQKNIIEGKLVDRKYTANDFYSTYYIYLNVIRALEVDKRLSSVEVGRVIGKMIAGLKKNGVAQLVVSGYPGAEDLRVTLRIAFDKRHNRPILVLVSNYDASKKEVVAGDALHHAYATFFFFSGDKLVKYQLVVNAAEKKRAAKKSVNDLADYYLLDAASDDDAKGKALLIKGIKKEKNDEERFMMNLTLSEYYLLENNPRAAKKALAEAKGIASSIGDDKKKERLLRIYQYASDLYKYMVNSQSV